MEKISLKTMTSLTSLCGNDFGKSIYRDQVKNRVKSKGVIEIVIPDNIDSVSMSFAQGFISDIAESHGISNVTKYIKIISKSPRVLRKFDDAIKLREAIK